MRRFSQLRLSATLCALFLAMACTSSGPASRTGDLYVGLRNAVLDLSIDEVKPEPPVAGLGCRMMVADIATDIGTSTLMASADGTVSVYHSNGGASLGLGEDENIREAAYSLLRSADSQKHLFSAVPSASGIPLPGPDGIRFTLRCTQGDLSVEGAQEEVLEETHPLFPIFMAVNDVFTKIRESPLGQVR